MKTFFGKLFTAFALAFGLGVAGSASATCPDNTSCFDSFQKIDISGAANFGGFGAGMFTGAEGGIQVDKVGFGSTELDLNVAGNTCGVDCQDGSFTFNAKAGEMVQVQGFSLGSTPGEAVSVINEGGAFSGATFQFGKLNIARPVP